MAIEFKASAGLTSYEEAMRFMDERLQAIIAGEAGECIWFLEHPPLYTAGRSATSEDLFNPRNLPVYDTPRGGQYTYHGPGQRVVYFMLDLNKRERDVRAFICKLEQLIIDTLDDFGVVGERREGRVGVWVDHMGDTPSPFKESKIAAIGVRIRRWVTSHGISINLAPELDDFSGIVPCGISDETLGVTSLKALGKHITMAELDQTLKSNIEKLF